MKLTRFGALSGMVFLLFACGEESTGESTINPAGNFATLKEEPTSTSARCETTGYGCGEINTTGNLVHGAFHFDDLFVTCTTSAGGYVVKMRNSITESPTFQLQVTLYGEGEPGIYYECAGSELNADKSGFKAGSCDVSVIIHQAGFSASKEQTCEVLFDIDESHVEGKISCPQLDLGRRYITIEKSKSGFTCQKEEQ